MNITYDFLIEENILEKLKSKIKINFNFFEKLKNKNQFRMKKMKRILASNGIDYKKIESNIQSKMKKFTAYGTGDDRIPIKDIIREIVEEMKHTPIPKQIGAGVLLTFCCAMFNTICLSLFMPIVGPTTAHIITAVIAAPISEEATKLISTKVGATGANFIIFNIAETMQYASQILAAGMGIPAVILYRTPAIIMHLVNTLRHKYYDMKGYDEGDRHRYNLRSFGENALFHSLFNFFASFGSYFAVLVGSIINIFDLNVKLKIIR